MASSRVSDDNEAVIVVGIDFGTTFSGVAWTWSGKAENIEIVTSWEADFHGNSDNDKVPTAIKLGDNLGGAITWGYATSEGTDGKEPLKWFKLLLLDDDDLPADVRESTHLKEARKYLETVNRSAVEIITLFLRHLWNHALGVIRTEIGESLVKLSRFHVVITLPAIWPAYACARMREAARDAGIVKQSPGGKSTLSFVSEPEAAAIATLEEMKGRHDVKDGDSFVVVDCGGGTVDIISYTVVSKEPMVIRECVKGEGGLCGAVFVDEAFCQLLKEKVGEPMWSRLPKSKFNRIINDEWEHGIKPQFTGKNRTWTIELPLECLGRLSDVSPLALTGLPKVVLTAQDIREAFKPVLKQIYELVETQISSVNNKEGREPKYIILVGGFGRCKYLYDCLKNRVGQLVLQARGSGPWTAICRGAVIKSLSEQCISRSLDIVEIESRISRASYGVDFNTEWVDGQFHKKDRYFSSVTQSYRASNQMDWFLREGDDISKHEPVRRAYCQRFLEPPASISNKILICHAKPPPRRRGATVKDLCTVTWDTKIDFTRLPTYTNPIGIVYYQLEYEVEMISFGGSVDFAVYHNDKRQGSRNVMVDFR